MSVEMLELALKCDLPNNLKSIFWGIANHTNPEGQGCWVGYDRLCYYTGYEERHVMRLVNQLEEIGIIVFQGFHPQFGTNMWNINIEKVPLKPEFKIWKQLRQAKRQAEKDTRRQADGVTSCHPPSGDILPSPLRVTFGSENGYEMSPEPFLEPTDNLLNHTAVFGKTATAPAPVSDPFLLNIPINERESIDDEITRGDDDENPETPRTDLERKVAQLCNAKHISEPMRRKLNTENFLSHGKERPRAYPSAEDEWKADPDKFCEYVEMCAKIQRTNSGRAPGRDALVGLIRNYARFKTGWLDFKDAQHTADAPLVQTEGKYYADPNAPAWMR